MKINSTNIEVVCSVILAWLAMIIIIGLLSIFPIMWLWNWLVPSLFNGPEITFWQTAGLYLLINLLIRTNLTINMKNI